MKWSWSVIIAGVLLAALLLAGTVAAGGTDLQFAKSGNNVTITGTTNLAPGDRLLVDVISAQFTPTVKGTATGFSGASGTVVVQPGSPLNTFSFEFDVSGFSPGLYLVIVTSPETSFQESGRFVLPWTPVPTSAIPTPAPVSPSGTTPAPTPSSMPSPQATPTQVPLSGIVSLAATVFAAGVLRLRR